LQVYSLIYSINSINRDIARFLSGIQDFGTSIKPHIEIKGRSFRALSDAINNVSDIVSKSRIETEKQLSFFEFVVDNIPAGVLIVNKKRQIIHTNKTANAIFRNHTLRSIGSLNMIYPKLGDEIDNLETGEQKTLRLKIENELVYLLFRVSSFRSENEELRIFSFQNVINELQENELIAWQKLTRLLTHEIMNSLTPISSLILATKKCLSQDSKPKTREDINDDSINDALLNLTLVEERSAGIKNFVSNFRKITQIPKLNLERYDINKLVIRTTLLYAKLFEEKKIRLKTDIDENLQSIDLDKKLIEQILINLINNSVDSLKSTDNKTITVSTFSKDQKTVIEITDNGDGIQDDIIDNIFMPFYTTKSEGMGIGLSLAQQVMRLHKGTISAMSIPGVETSFFLTF
jgi:nitrogen fixation/metabolism regulation signal transduction histidine kinase